MRTAWLACLLAASLNVPLLAGEPGLVAHWNFAEGKGAALRDRSGHNNHGTIKGATWIRNGEGYALEFDGLDDHVDCGAGKSLGLTQKVTILAWVRPAARLADGEAGIAGKKYAAYAITQAKSSVYGYFSGGPNYVKSQWAIGRWHHVASVYDGAILRLYLDGRLAMTRPIAKTVKPGGNFWLARSDGTLEYTKDAHFKGAITDVRVYDRPLARAEIIRHLRATNITNTLSIIPTPIAHPGKLVIELDKRGLGSRGKRAGVRLTVHRNNPGGEPARRASLRAVADRFDDLGAATLTLNAASLEAGEYTVRAVAGVGRRRRIGQPTTATFAWPRMQVFPRGPMGARKLNNLVTELLSVSGPDTSAKRRTFTNPRNGWIFITNQGAPNVTVSPQATGQPLAVPLGGETHGPDEAMRYLAAGAYTLTTPRAEKLVVRAVPHLLYAYYNKNPRVTQFGKFEGRFQEEHVFPNINTHVRDNDAAALAWTRHGKRWLGHISFVRWSKAEQASPDFIYERITEEPGFAKSQYGGLVANEFGDSHPKCAGWAQAVDKALSDPKYEGKGFYPYANVLATGPEGRQLVQTLIKHSGAILCERYLKEQRTELDAWRTMHRRLVEPAGAYRLNCPGSIPLLILNFGIFSGPPETLDTFPHVSHKTYLDMQFNMAATHPAFQDLGGFMSYEASYSDEETVRWAMRLFRHYAIEGHTTMLSDDPYILPHLRNGDFELKGESWSLRPAAGDSIRFGNHPGFGWMQGRYPRTAEGDTVLIATRHKDRPNVFSQRITDLQPGRLYTLRMFTGDFKDMTSEQTYALKIDIENVTVLPERSFVHIFSPHRVHYYAPYHPKTRKAWLNYHWILFRAKAPTAELSISDWARPREPGGPIDQELMINFVQIQPYFQS